MDQVVSSSGPARSAASARGAESINLLTIDAKGLQSLLADRKFTSLDLVRQCLAQIQQHDGYLHAMIETTPVHILEETATSLDRERAGGTLRGPLHGIPILVKVCCVE